MEILDVHGLLSSTLICPSCQCAAVDLDPKSPAYPAHPVPLEGRIMIVTDVGAGCGGRGMSKDE
jgi:hypothetical protein